MSGSTPQTQSLDFKAYISSQDTDSFQSRQLRITQLQPSLDKQCMV